MNGTVTTYVLHGKNVVHLTQGSNNLHFFYGADGSPAIVKYNGVSYGDVKNLQGDVIGIVNASGAYVVQYAYDAWGRLLSKTGSMASTLGTLNPFRYREYNINITQDKIRRLRNLVSHRGYDLQEIIETDLDLFGG